MESLSFPFIGIELINVIVMCILILQFLRIHKKRSAMLHAFDFDGELGGMIARERFQALFVVVFYTVCTLLITLIAAGLFFFRPHWL